MKRTHASFGAFAGCLVALSFGALGCIEGAQDFELYQDGSGTITIDMKVGKEFSEMAAMSFEGKSQDELNAEAMKKMSEDFRGVYWESATQKLVDGQVVMHAVGLFEDIRKVKMVEKKTDVIDGKMVKRTQDKVAFKFTPNASGGGVLDMKMDTNKKKKKKAEKAEGGDEAGGMDEAEKKKMEAMAEKMMKDLKFRISVKPPGKITKNGLMDLKENRAGFEFTLAMIKDKMIEKEMSALDGKVEWENGQAAPAEFKKRLAAAKAKAKK